MQASLQIFLDDSNLLVSCPNPACRFTFEPVAGAVDKSDAKGPDGKPLSKEANEHRVRCRFRCAKCATVFCSQCHAIPYHVGFTCEQYKAFKEAQHCRFCNDSLSDANTAKPPPAGAEEALKCVCTKPECLAKRAKSCGKVHQCGHPCGGLSGEAECLPCLHSECRPDEEKTAIDDFCNICWVESIGQAPALKLKCGHIFHESCLVERLQKKWSGARINFGFLKCPLCKKQIAHPSLEATLKPYLKLLQDVEAKALQRLKFEGLDKDPNITDPNAKYYGQPAAYALDRFAYYPCFKCNRPYFGGRRACEEAARDEDEKFDPKELVCGSCAANSEAQNCKVHGREFIEYKCKWCCEVASFFCWGTTHFCVSCHKRQEQGDYLTKKKRSELPVCQGPGKCKLGGKHPPNGEEFALGCAICRRMTA
jgi:E3 ubiquitin-protein ligase MYCBP2